MKDYYSILEVDKKASNEDIKKSYRRLSMKYHPDRNPDDKESEDKFKEISEAYSVLSNEQKRRDYDNPNPLGDGFSPFGGMNPFHNMRRNRPDPNAPRAGSPLAVEAEIPLKTFVFGGNFRVTLNYEDSCLNCNGKGFSVSESCDFCNGEGFIQHTERRPGFVSNMTRPCPKCRGLGEVGKDNCEICNGAGTTHTSKTFNFEIPPGSGPGSRFIERGSGRLGVNGGKNGDVVLVIGNIRPPVTDKLSSDKLEQLKALLEELDNEVKSS